MSEHYSLVAEPVDGDEEEHNYLGRLCAKDGCPNVPTPGYLLCADCAAAGGNV